MKRLAFLLIVLFAMSSCCTMKIHQGDLLFQDLRCGPLCDAIDQATYGYNGYNINHMGIVVRRGMRKYVLEAYKKVQLTPLHKFLYRSTDENGRPLVIVGRLKPQYRYLLPKAIDYGLSLVGKPYDSVFVLNNGAYYCSELIYEMFKHANNGKDFFPVYPMNFKSLKTGQIPQVWKQYFAKYNMYVPQYQMGCNPADYSRSKKIQIVAQCGKMRKTK